MPMTMDEWLEDNLRRYPPNPEPDIHKCTQLARIIHEGLEELEARKLSGTSPEQMNEEQA